MPVGTGTAIAAGSAIAGGLLGGKGQTSTSTSKPYMPKEYEEGYGKILEDALKLYAQPYQPVQTARVETNPMTPMDKLFASPEMMEIQKQNDQAYYQKALQPRDDPAANAAAEQEAIDSLRNEMLGRQFLQGLQGQKGYGNVMPTNYDNEALALFGELTGGRSGHQGLMAAQGGDAEKYMKFLQTLNAPRMGA